MHTFKVGDRVEALLGVPQDPHTPFLIGGTISEVAHNIIGQALIAWVDWDNGRKTRHMKSQTQLIRIEKEPAMTDRKNHLHKLDKQRTTAQEFEKYYKELRETIEAEIVTVTNQREIIIGQLWKYACTREYYIVTMSSELSLELTNVHAGGVLKIPTSSIQEHFNYIGMACNHVKVTE